MVRSIVLLLRAVACTAVQDSTIRALKEQDWDSREAAPLHRLTWQVDEDLKLPTTLIYYHLELAGGCPHVASLPPRGQLDLG